VEVYERRSDPRSTGLAEGKSINLAISTRGFHALRQVGLAERILEMAVPMHGRLMHDRRGHTVFQSYGTGDDHTIKSVSRGGLNLELIRRADEYPNVRFHFDQNCVGCDPDRPSITVKDQTGIDREVAGDVIVGADGAFSAVRRSLQRKTGFDYSQSYLRQGYKELTIPPAVDGGFRIDPDVLHIWPRGGFMLIALPNLDKSFTVTLFWPQGEIPSLEDGGGDDEVERYFYQEFPDAVPLMPDLAEDFRRNPTGSLVTVRSAPWHYKGKVVLLGDASHAVVPFYGQGANAAFEDCTVLLDAISRHPSDMAAAFHTYYVERKAHVDVLADLAIQNFQVMSEHVMSRGFLLRKKLDQFLDRMFATAYIPLYTMISFTRIPYGDALRKAQRQDRTLKWVAAGVGVLATLAIWIALL
jgi:kynurenine 3-monooxygenase